MNGQQATQYPLFAETKSAEHRLYAHAGTSMNPTLSELDMLEIKAFEDESIRTGDVVLFRTKTSELLIVHRIIATTKQGFYTQGYQTRGDNHVRADSDILEKQHILGQVTAAWRGNHRRVVHGGIRGYVIATLLYLRLKTGRYLSYLPRLLYHQLSQSAVMRKWLQPYFSTTVIIFWNNIRYPMHLRIGL